MAGNNQVVRRMDAAATLMRQRGLIVGSFAGWRDAGRSSVFSPRALIAHHTAAPVDVDRILRDGRPDLPGPLCNWALHRDGSWWAVASGRANHAGVGVLPSSEAYGVECTGPIPTGAEGPDAFPMYEQYVIGVACICEVEGWDARVVYGHKETARPDCRKPDPAFGDGCPTPYADMDTFRGQVQWRIDHPPEEDDTMSAEDVAVLKKYLDGKFDDLTELLRRVDHGDGTVASGKTGRVDDNDHATIRADIADVKALVAPPEPPA